MPGLQVGVVLDLFVSDSFCMIEVEHPRRQINHERVGMGDKGGERNPGLDGKKPNILLSTGTVNTTKSLLRQRSQIVQYLVELINTTKRL